MIIVIFIVQPLPQEVNKYMECYVQDDKMITDFKVMSTRSPYPILKLSQFFFCNIYIKSRNYLHRSLAEGKFSISVSV